MRTTLHLTDPIIKSLPSPKEKRSYYHDDKETDLILQVTHMGKKSFYLQKRFNGQPHMFFVGDFERMGVGEARLKATEMKFKISRGLDPNQREEKIVHKDGLRLEAVYQMYLQDKRKLLRPKTIEDYMTTWNKHILPVLGCMVLTDISSVLIKQFHNQVSEVGPYAANRALCLVKSLFNYAIEQGLYEKVNPCNLVRKNPEEARSRYLTSDEMHRFFNALKHIKDQTTRDAILMLIFTGARKSNVLAMRWQDIDLNLKVWKIPQTKTGKNMTLPLADPAVEILEDRNKANTTHSPWVFSSDKSRLGHLQGLKRQWQNILRTANLHNLHVHDLRHTMGTYLAANGSSAATIQRALTHKTFQSSQVYVNLDVEHIRGDVNKAVESMMKLGKI